MSFQVRIPYFIKQIKEWVQSQLDLKSNKNLGKKTKIVGTDNNGNITATDVPTQILDGLKDAYNNSASANKLIGLSGNSNPVPIATTIAITDVAKIVRIFNGEDGNTSASDEPYDYGYRFMNAMIDGAISSCWATNLTGSRILGTSSSGKIQVTDITTDELDKINFLQNINTSLDILLAKKADSSSVPTLSSTEYSTTGKISGLGSRSSSVPNLGNQDDSSVIQIGNIIIQCGNFDTHGATGNNAFTNNKVFDIKFPIQFPNKCMVVVASTAQYNIARTAGNGPQIISTVLGWDKTKFRIMGDHTNDDLRHPSGISWIAIGN
ncbi:MAG: hypothetical protein IKA36_04785 [Clostridia bacterium]|nr:hypothetical protein [Clostridia bacterium]